MRCTITLLLNKKTVNDKRFGFTISELLFVLGILFLIAGLLMGAIVEARNISLKNYCQNKIKNLGLGLANCQSHHGHLPPLGDGSNGIKSDPHFYLTWLTDVLPFIEQEPLWIEADSACKIDPLVLSNPPHTGMGKVVPQLICPSDANIQKPLTNPYGKIKGYASYLSISSAISSPLGKFGGQRTAGVMRHMGPGIRFSEILDGTSQTLLIGERPVPHSLQAGHWYGKVPEPYGPTVNGILDTPPIGDMLDLPCQGYPQEYGPGRLDNPCDRDHFWSLHRNGANFAMADGSVRFIPYSAKNLIPLLATISGGEIIPDLD